MSVWYCSASWELRGLLMKNCQIFHFPLEMHGAEFYPTLFMLSGGLVAKVNDLASRLHLMFMEVWNFSQGNNFVLDRLIYILVIKFKTHKLYIMDCNCQQGVGLMCMLLCMIGCVIVCACITYKHNSLMPRMPKSHHQTFCVYCIVSVISHTFL